MMSWRHGLRDSFKRHHLGDVLTNNDVDTNQWLRIGGWLIWPLWAEVERATEEKAGKAQS